VNTFYLTLLALLAIVSPAWACSIRITPLSANLLVAVPAFLTLNFLIIWTGTRVIRRKTIRKKLWIGLLIPLSFFFSFVAYVVLHNIDLNHMENYSPCPKGFDLAGDCRCIKPSADQIRQRAELDKLFCEERRDLNCSSRPQANDE